MYFQNVNSLYYVINMVLIWFYVSLFLFVPDTLPFHYTFADYWFVRITWSYIPSGGLL